MKRTFHHFMRLLLPLAIMILLSGITVSAATKVVNLEKKNGLYMYTGDFETAPEAVLHKIKVLHAGTLAVSGSSMYNKNIYGIGITLCNSKGKELEYKYLNSDKDESVIWAVNKGTYYLKVKNEKLYVIGTKYTKISDNNGAKKSKAKAVSKNKKAKGILGSGEKASKKDWYKFKVKSSKVLYLDLVGIGTSAVSFKLYGPSYPNGISLGSLYDNAKTVWSVRGSSKAPVKKGTYYLRITRSTANKKSSATYYFKWYLK